MTWYLLTSSTWLTKNEGKTAGDVNADRITLTLSIWDACQTAYYYIANLLLNSASDSDHTAMLGHKLDLVVRQTVNWLTGPAVDS